MTILYIIRKNGGWKQNDSQTYVSLGGLIVHERMTRVDFRVDTRRVNRACDFQKMTAVSSTTSAVLFLPRKLAFQTVYHKKIIQL